MKKILLTLLLIPFLGIAQTVTIYSNDFSAATGFTVIDNDGDTANWGLFSSSPTTVGWGLTGGFAGSKSWNAPTATPPGALTPDNFLISPAFTIPTAAGTTASISFKLGANDPAAFAEKISVYVFASTVTTAAGIIATTPVFTRTLTLANSQTALTYSAIIPAALSGQLIKVALRHHDCTDQNLLYFDDLLITQTTLSTSDFSKNNLKVYPNPSSDMVSVSSNNNSTIETIEVTDVNGRIVKNVVANNTFSVKELTSGVYFLKITTTEGVGTTKFVKQ